jgi:hypothetical protein
MNYFLDAKNYGLSSRTKLVEISEKEVAVFIDRKSRFIMKDGDGFLKKVDTIQQQFPELTVSLKIHSAICSKTLTYLKAQKIKVYQKQQK